MELNSNCSRTACHVLSESHYPEREHWTHKPSYTPCNYRQPYKRQELLARIDFLLHIQLKPT